MKLFNDLLDARFQTLERNIKSKSNSFFDSFLSLLESTIKYILDENKIEYDDSRTCGYLVRSETIKEFLLSTLKLDDYTYNKILDYIKKCNDHKHKKEKYLGVESIVNYLRIYYNLINYYIDLIKGIRIEFNAEYFVSIYGETEKLNIKYKKEVLQLREQLQELIKSNKLSEQDIRHYESLLSIKEVELLNLDDQNQKLQEQISILKDIKLNTIEEKLNKTIDLLNDLSEFVVESRAITYGVGLVLIDEEGLEKRISKARDLIKEKLKKED